MFNSKKQFLLKFSLLIYSNCIAKQSDVDWNWNLKSFPQQDRSIFFKDRNRRTLITRSNSHNLIPKINTNSRGYEEKCEKRNFRLSKTNRQTRHQSNREERRRGSWRRWSIVIEVVFHRPIIERLIGPGNFGRNSAPAKFPKIYDRRVPGEFREPWSWRNMLTRGGRLVYPRLSAAPDARSTLPAGCGNQPSRNCWASSSRTKLYPSWRTCNNDGIPLSHRGGSLLGSSFFDIIGLWHREDPRQRARLQIGGHSRRRTLDTLCMSLGWQSGPDTRHRSSGLFAAKTEPRKFRSGKDRRGRSTTRLLPPPSSTVLNTNSILANIPRVQIVFDISRPLSNWD